MAEINPDFSFPTSRPKSVGFAPPPSRRIHAHRRSAAMSEDLSLEQLNQWQLQSSPSPSFGSPLPPAGAGSAPTPSVLSSYAPRPASPLLQVPSPVSASHWRNPSAPSSPVLYGAGGAAMTASSSSLSSQATNTSQKHLGNGPSMTGSAPPNKVKFARPPSPNHSPQMQSRRPAGNIGEPLQLAPSLPPPTPPIAEPSGPGSSSGNSNPGKTSKKHKRRSLVRLFRKPSSSSTKERPPDAPATPESAYLTPPMPQGPRFSPQATPRHSHEFTSASGGGGEPEPPSIDLDEVLQSSFSHRRADSMPAVLDSPFSKGGGSYIGPVLEEEDESSESTQTSSDPPAPQLSIRTVHSPVASLSIPEPRYSSSSSVRFSPQRYSPEKSGRMSPDRMSVVGRMSPDRQSAIRISPDPPTPPQQQQHQPGAESPKKHPHSHSHKPSATSSSSKGHTKGHTRRRSLVDRMLGRQVK